MLKMRQNTAERITTEFWEVLEEWNRIESFQTDQNTLCDLQNRAADIIAAEAPEQRLVGNRLSAAVRIGWRLGLAIRGQPAEDSGVKSGSD
jgi:hypothetical protein